MFEGSVQFPKGTATDCRSYSVTDVNPRRSSVPVDRELRNLLGGLAFTFECDGEISHGRVDAAVIHQFA